jgi:hypothetical protein
MFSIFYDAALKKPLNPVVLADEVVVIGDVLSKNSAFEDRNAMDEQWFPIVEAYCANSGITIERMRPEEARPARAVERASSLPKPQAYT